jgi:hypothetical protein
MSTLLVSRRYSRATERRTRASDLSPQFVANCDSGHYLRPSSACADDGGGDGLVGPAAPSRLRCAYAASLPGIAFGESCCARRRAERRQRTAVPLATSRSEVVRESDAGEDSGAKRWRGRELPSRNRGGSSTGTKPRPRPSTQPRRTVTGTVRSTSNQWSRPLLLRCVLMLVFRVRHRGHLRARPRPRPRCTCSTPPGLRVAR